MFADANREVQNLTSADFSSAMIFIGIGATGLFVFAAVMSAIYLLITYIVNVGRKMEQNAEWRRFNDGWEKHKKRCAEGFRDSMMRTSN